MIASCETPEDCALYGTCEGALIEYFQAELGDEGEHCGACLAQACKKYEPACATEIACNRAARCMLKTDPVEYQGCLTELFERGHSSAKDTRAWEGPVDDFIRCVDSSCAAECGRETPVWSCEYDAPNFRRSTRTIELAVRLLETEPSRVHGATVSFCSETDTSCKSPLFSGITNEDGRLRVELEADVLNGHFEVSYEPDPELFPPTLYYPGLLGPSGTQPLALSLIPTWMVRSYNEMLGRGHEVLSDKAQSVIWPESCNRLDQLLAPDVEFRVAGASVGLCDGDGAPPCIWYTGEDGPDPTLDQSQGHGGGIVGLEGGPYTIEACADGNLVSRRRVLMRKGSLTIVRTWPLTNTERKQPWAMDHRCAEGASRER